jgi:hypothetical protein
MVPYHIIPDLDTHFTFSLSFILSYEEVHVISSKEQLTACILPSYRSGWHIRRSCTMSDEDDQSDCGPSLPAGVLRSRGGWAGDSMEIGERLIV